MSDISNQRKLQHLYLRAGFGASISEINKSLEKPIPVSVEELFSNSKSFTDLALDDGSELKNIAKGKGPNRVKAARENTENLNIEWIDKMTKDNDQLREKMTLFWHGHFACRTTYPHFTQNQNNTLRRNALGNFATMLMEVSKDPAMLQFLNNQQNKKSSPNENFAREVMELFTLGRGNYSETDIKEAARAFTGWSFDQSGEYNFKENVHDFDEKTFLGKTGNFSGEDIINILLENKRTAEFITNKIYVFFVNDNINTEITKELSKKFYESDYNIEGLMKNIFLSDWFYSDENIGAKIKSPIELLVNMIKSFNIKFKNQKPLLNLQKALGQMLFYPPNVSGWAGGKSWIDTSSLIFRLKLPELIFKSAELEFDYKEEPQEMGEYYKQLTEYEKRQYKQLNTSVDLSSYINEFSKYNENELTDKLCEYLIQKELNKNTKSVLTLYEDDSNKDNMIQSLTLRIISLPEYQLC